MSVYWGMPTSLRRLRHLAFLPALLVAAASCENSVSIEQDELAGSYTATSFLMTQTRGPTYDVLALGGSLTIKINADSTMTGQLVFPAGIPNANPGTADMSGRVKQKLDGTFYFDQPANTFVNQLIWQQYTGALVSTTFLVTTQFQITLRK